MWMCIYFSRAVGVPVHPIDLITIKGEAMPQHHMEILAPAGDFDMLRAAVFSGADCVYLGVQGFNARGGAANFDPEALRRAVGFCHARGCKVYAALNTLVLPGEEPALIEAIQAVAQAGCDAVIVQDLGAAQTIQQMVPALPLHASTQMSVHSLAGVQQLAQMGFSRVILARELSRDEIAYIAQRSPIELEVFVHGALCVSVSGQCTMSAFLGGRSANRGACAGPCRLPFAAERGSCPEQKGVPEESKHALSLKDLSVLDALPQLAQMGVVSAKIEGRLRGPEYGALAVDAARKALAGEPYDKDLLRDVFSRSGFTDEWYTGKNSAGIFGARTVADSAAAKAALPKARELYRRERARVPVDMQLTLSEEGARLVVSDGVHTLQGSVPGPLQQARQAADAPLHTALAKTGGTPFYLREATVRADGFYLPASEVGNLRRQLLEELLALREKASLWEVHDFKKTPPAYMLAGEVGEYAARMRAACREKAAPLLRARFAHVAQLPPSAGHLCTELLLPIGEAGDVPQELRGKTILYLPRAEFGREEQRVADAIEQTKDMGFAGYQAQNIAHMWLCRGLPLHGGFGLNVTNIAAAEVAAQQGCSSITLSSELSLRQMAAITKELKQDMAPLADALCYGHLPLMLTRACPLKQVVPSCDECSACGYLTDRKGERFSVVCDHGVREIYNPVPLWMADRLAEMPAHIATLYFTTETARQAEEVLQAFANGQKAPATFTRGLYDKGVTQLLK